MTQRIGALTISQSPRHDLTQPLHHAFPDAEIIEVGALDFIDVNNLHDGSDAYYPLTTSLNSGEVVTLDRDFLSPLLQDGLDDLKHRGVDATILLCAGDFRMDVIGENFVIPTNVAQSILKTMNMTDMLVISPIELQNKPIKDKWLAKNFQPTVVTMPSDTSTAQRIDWINQQVTEKHSCIVLDYVGYPMEEVRKLQQGVNKPLFELGQLAIATLKSIL